MERGKGLATCLVSVLIALTMAATFPVPSPDSIDATTQASEPTVLRIGFMQKIDSLNPYVGYSDAAYVFYGLIYDTMMCVGNDLETVPNLATSWYAVPTTDPWMISSGEPYGSVWQYNLTTNASWSDGEPFTADDVVFAVNLNAGNYTNMWSYQPYSYFMRYAEKVSDHVVRVHFFDRGTGNPTPAAYASMISIPILPKHMMTSMTPQDIGFNWTGLFSGVPSLTVGTGPFMGTSALYNKWFTGESLTLVKNPLSHWSSDYGMNVSFDEIELVFFDDATAMSLALKMGDIDVASLPPQAYVQLRSEIASGALKNIQTFDGPKITGYWTDVGFNMNVGGPNPSRLDPVIRQALAMTTDKQYIVDNFYLGLAEPGSTMIPPFNEYWHYNLSVSEKFPVDYQAARDMLQASGYIDIDSDGVRECTASSRAVQEGWALADETELVYQMMVRREYPEEKYIAQYLQNEWSKIGVILVISIVDEVQLASEVYYYQYDTVLWYWSSDIDPNYQLFVQTKMAWGGWSDNMYYSQAYDENYSLSVSAMDPAQRKVYVDNCQRINYRDVSYIVLAYVNQTYAWRTDTFSGWGDWANDPGRSLDNFWTGNPLWFDLTPLPPPLDVSFTVSPAEGNIQTVFDFNASASFGNGSIAGIELCWDWNSDGVPDTSWSSENSSQYQFDVPGAHNVTLRVRHLASSLFMNVSKTVTLRDELPDAAFWISTLMGDNHTIFSVDASWSSDLETPVADLEVRWDWEGDGVYDTTWSTEKTSAHEFSDARTYNVTLQVRDSANQTSQWVVRIMVLDTAIPEFPSLVLPLLGLCVIVASVVAFRRRRA